jgi:hypothetical protein
LALALAIVYRNPGWLASGEGVAPVLTIFLPGIRIISKAENVGEQLTRKKHFTPEEARRIGEALGINWTGFDVEQYRIGLDVELEHGLVDPQTNVTDDDPIITGKIALAHLKEIPDYYTRLDKMEREAEGR